MKQKFYLQERKKKRNSKSFFILQTFIIPFHNFGTVCQSHLIVFYVVKKKTRKIKREKLSHENLNKKKNITSYYLMAQQEKNIIRFTFLLQKK